MAVSVARPDAVAAGARSLVRVRVGTTHALALLVAVSASLRLVAAWLRTTPIYLPDEYMYSELGRSLSESARPLVRGVEASFPALLQPVLTAPFWLVADVERAFRLVQGFGTIAMSLAAPAAYLLARRVGVSGWPAFGVAALAVAVPDMIYSGWLLAEPFTYPLVIAAAVAAVAALDRPSPRVQLLFVGLAGLAILGRAQFVAIPMAFVLSAFVVGLRERRLRTVLREQALPLALFAVPVLLALAVGRERVFGIYSAPFGQSIVDTLSMSNMGGANALLLLYICGFVLVPGALLGLVLAVARPRSRAELALGAVAVSLGGALLAEAAIFGALHVAQERYVFYVVPLLATSFALYASRGWPLRRVHALLAAGLLLVSARWPLAKFTGGGGWEHSPTLLALGRLERLVGNPGTASLVIAALAAIGCLLAIAAPWRPRAGTAVAFSAAIAASVAGSIGAVSWDVGNTAAVSREWMPADKSWVDHSGLENVVLMRNFGGKRVDSIQLFWNRSVDRVVLMQGADPLDPFRNDKVSIARDGSLSVAGKSLKAPLLVDEYAVTVRFSGATRVAKAPIHSLWRPDGRPRLSLFMFGRYFDGWLGGGGGINLWPAAGEQKLAGYLTMRLRAPEQVGGTTITFDVRGERPNVVRLRAGEWQTVRIPVCADGPWQSEFKAAKSGGYDDRVVSARSTEPVFRPDAGACGQTAF